MNNVRSFVNYAIFCELCDQMRSEVDCPKSHHHVISKGLYHRSHTDQLFFHLHLKPSSRAAKTHLIQNLMGKAKPFIACS